MAREIFRLIILFLTGLVLPPQVTAVGDQFPCPSACEIGREKVATLVADFEQNKDFYKSRAFSEADARAHFIDGFFEALGWDVANSAGYQLYQQDTVPEARLWKRGAVHYADYGFRIDGRTAFYVEAEAISRDIDNQEYIDQAVGYAWSSTYTDIAIVTDFEEFRVFDARRNPYAAQTGNYEIMSLHLSYKDFVARFPELWAKLSKEAVAEGSLTQLLADLDPVLIRESVNEAFLGDLDRFRLDLGRALHANNPKLDIDQLNEATHHILNQIVFGRVLEDRDIEPTGRLREAIEAWRSRGGKDSLWSFVRAEFGRLERRYNGVIFAAHFSDKLKIPNDVLAEVIDSLYPPTSPYAFSIIPIDVLGRAYESYLGKRLELKDGILSLAPKPEVRRAGGVFYTPDWVVDYILDQTLGPKVKGKSANELLKLRVVDPACGAGAFSVQMASRILESALEHYAKNEDQIGGKGTEFPDAYTLFDGTLKLSVTKKAELIENTVFCVDVDPQAVEITRMWLYILMLEKEASPIVTRERQYKIPNRIWSTPVRDFKLPDLTGNIVNANSLVGVDFSEDSAERDRVLAFDWDNGNSRLATVVTSGGFDVVAGNPPYLRSSDARQFIPSQHEYMRSSYHSMGEGQADMSYAFIEKGLSLLNPGGKLGFITSNGFIWNNSGASLRKVLAESNSVKELVDFGVAKIFKDAGPATAIVILDRAPHRKFQYGRLFLKDLGSNVLLSEMPAIPKVSAPLNTLQDTHWALPSSEDREIFDAMHRHTLKISDVAETFTGTRTGDDKVFLVEKLQVRGKYAEIKGRNSDKTYLIEKELLKPFVRTRHIQRYGTLPRDEWIIFPYTNGGDYYPVKILRDRYPKAYAYFLDHKNMLAPSSQSKVEKPWYAITAVTGLDLVSRRKLLNGWQPGKAQFTLDRNGEFFFQGSGRNTAVVVKDKDFTLEMLLGVLNSEPIIAYARSVRAELWNGMPLSTTLVGSFPIVPMTNSSRPIYSRIAKIVDEILKANETASHQKAPARLTKLEKEIDVLVERLYFSWE